MPKGIKKLSPGECTENLQRFSADVLALVLMVDNLITVKAIDDRFEGMLKLNNNIVKEYYDRPEDKT